MPPVIRHTASNPNGFASGIYKWKVTASDQAGIQRVQVYLQHNCVRPTRDYFRVPGDALASTTLTLMWKSTSDAVSFDVQIANDEGFGDIVWESLDVPAAQAVDGIHYAQVPLGNLANAGVYYWRVSGENTLGTCIGRTPCTSDWVSQRLAILDARPTYELQIMVDGDIVQPIPEINSYLVNGDVFHDLQDRHRLQEGRNYTWTVAAKDRAGNVKMSDDTFTIVVSDQYAPELQHSLIPRLLSLIPNQPLFGTWSATQVVWNTN